MTDTSYNCRSILMSETSEKSSSFTICDILSISMASGYSLSYDITGLITWSFKSVRCFSYILLSVDNKLIE